MKNRSPNSFTLFQGGDPWCDLGSLLFARKPLVATHFLLVSPRGLHSFKSFEHVQGGIPAAYLRLISWGTVITFLKNYGGSGQNLGLELSQCFLGCSQVSCQNKVIAQLTETPLLLPLRNDHNLQPALPTGSPSEPYCSGCVSVSHLRANTSCLPSQGNTEFLVWGEWTSPIRNSVFTVTNIAPFFLQRCLTGFLTWQLDAILPRPPIFLVDACSRLGGHDQIVAMETF